MLDAITVQQPCFELLTRGPAPRPVGRGGRLYRMAWLEVTAKAIVEAALVLNAMTPAGTRLSQYAVLF